MSSLDANVIKRRISKDLRDRLARLDIFAEVDSTNSYLMQRLGPQPGAAFAAVTSNQTAGRGQRGRRWESPPDSGVCLSLAYTYSKQPANLSAVTIAIGLSAILALEALGVEKVSLKWPNDLVANNGKLGGILTETQQHPSGTVTVVSGIGVNVEIPNDINVGAGTKWASHIADLASLSEELPSRSDIAGEIIDRMLRAMVDFEHTGLTPWISLWPRYDWLIGREISVNAGGERISGIGSGIAENGALLVATENTGVKSVTSGSVVAAGQRGLDA